MLKREKKKNSKVGQKRTLVTIRIHLVLYTQGAQVLSPVYEIQAPLRSSGVLPHGYLWGFVLILFLTNTSCRPCCRLL